MYCEGYYTVSYYFDGEWNMRAEWSLESLIMKMKNRPTSLRIFNIALSVGLTLILPYRLYDDFHFEYQLETRMYGWERIASACGMGCKVFMSPWANPDKAPYDAVMKEDDDVTEPADKAPVTSEPRVPDWGDLSIRAPIVKNKSNSALNSRNSTASYDKLPATGSVPKLYNKRLSTPDLAGSRGSLTGSKTSLTGSTESNDVLEVQEMVTTV